MNDVEFTGEVETPDSTNYSTVISDKEFDEFEKKKTLLERRQNKKT